MRSTSKGPRRNEVVELEVERLIYGGQGLGRYEGMVVFLDRVAPGDRVRARITKRKRSHAEAVVEEIVAPGPGRREAPCESFGRCGGCAWQHLDDATQTAVKAEQVRESLERLGGLRDMPEGFFRPAVAAPAPFHYRNKLDYSFGFDQHYEPAVGFHLRGDFRRVVAIPRCHIHPQEYDALLAALRGWMAEYPEELEPYHKTRHTGYLRTFVIRRSEATGESLAMILTNGSRSLPGGGAEGLMRRLQVAVPGLVGLVHGVNTGLADFQNIEAIADRCGRDWFIETLGETRFQVSIQSFFQTNTRAAELLYDVVRREAKLTPDSVLLDAYCGTGSIGIFCGSHVAQLYGIEIVESAVEDARRNAALNGLGDRAIFWAGDIRDRLPDLHEHLGSRRLTHLVIDPPRGGMHKKALADLLELRAPRLVYVSCNPTTLARDAQQILEAGYVAESVTPVDMFPQTYHVEAVMPFRLSGE
jgi:23S rRNA (uracil1939-C5)-methyltransferase